MDFKRARHEIPLIDQTTGEVLYGLDGLMLIISNIFPFLKPLLTHPYFKKLLKPLYKFISYNRRVIAGSPAETCNATYFGPDFHLGWRMALIGLGFGYTALSVFLFSKFTGISALILYTGVGLYGLLLFTITLTDNTSREQKWDYFGHLSTLSIIESTLFLFSAGLAKLTGLIWLMFAGQIAARFLATTMHAKRVAINGYSKLLNYAFAVGAIGMIILIVIFETRQL